MSRLCYRLDVITILQVKNISKKYVTGDLEQIALNNVSLTFRDSEFVAILGPSGSGKTTLLNVIGGLDRYDSGDLIINGVSTNEYSDRDWDSYRNHTIGFVFQSYNLIPHQTILGNVELALTISNVSPAERKARALEALRKVGLEEQAHKKPNQLSGGQMQRVAIARALVNNPDIILADEPTGALDTKTSVQIMDLLKEVADDRLVVMVTHNPELAEEYATRIINLRDGEIISDSMPVENDATETVKQKPPKTSLGFFTALALSLNNLRTKKGRTILTSFAGSVGIIGIALILALSNGVNLYIKSIEQEMLGSYPVTLMQQTFDMEGLMANSEEMGAGGFFGGGSSSDDKTKDEKAADEAEREKRRNSDKFYSNNIIAESIEMTTNLMKENDLASFKKYLDKNGSKIDDKVTAIEYSYNISPLVFRNDSKNGIVKVTPASLNASGDAENMMGNMLSAGLTTSWSQMNNSKALRNQQFELLEGKWPEKANEIALVLNLNNSISDFTLYSLGLLDISDMDKLLDAINKGKKYEDKEVSFNYSDAIGKTYKAFAPAELYKQADGIYVNKADEEDYMKTHIDKGKDVTITGVFRVKDDSGAAPGIYYTGELTRYLINQTKDTDVVKAQLANDKVNVLTGREFSENVNGFSSGFNLSSIFGGSAGGSGAMMGSFMSTTDSETGRAAEVPEVTYDMYRPNTVTPTPLLAQTSRVNSVPNLLPKGNIFDMMLDYVKTTMTQMFTQAFKGVLSTGVIQDLVEGYLDSLSDEEKQELISQFASTFTEEDIAKMMEQYMGDIDFESIAAQYIGSMSQEDMQKLVSQFVGSMTEEEMQALVAQFAGSLDGIDIQSFLEKYLAENSDELMKAMQDFMSSDQLQAMIAEFTGASPTSPEQVLQSLSYYTEDEPSAISIYPLDFESKKVIEDFITEYNSQVKDDSEKVSYTDIIGTITSSITKIVDVISYVLIAFVAISLIVSSIMIAIITHISVLERTKEIGVLRALGSSKRDISRIFNAETFIEGFFSGLIGVIFTWLTCIPINHLIEAKYNVENVAYLPLGYAIILIALSVVLTLLAGFFPSRTAAKKDPVLALRSE